MKKVIYYVIILVALLNMIPLTVFAETVDPTHGFDTKDLSEEKIQTFWENIELQLLEEEAGRDEIECFAVHPDGRVALGFEDSNEKTIYVYNENGLFLYGYRFLASGTFGFAWNGDDLSIYFGRSNYILTVDRHGQCVACEEKLYTENSDERTSQVLYGTHLDVGDKEYFLESDYSIVERSYSRLVVRTADGTERILYDVTQEHNIGTIVRYVFVAMFVCAVIVIQHMQTKGKNHNEADRNI